MKLKTLKQIRNLVGKHVLLRVDFNVPIKGKKVMDDTRIKAVLPTIKYLIKNKAKIILVTHLGRPKGIVVSELRVTLIAKRLSDLLNKKIEKLSVSTGKKVEESIKKLKNGQILFLENIQFEPGETANDPELAKTLASYADYYVTDNFAQAHRDYASISTIAKYMPAYAGLLLEKEIIGLSKVMEKPKKPFVVVLGGIKMETKIPVLKNLLTKADHILIGGGISNTYFWAKGYKVGKSLIDKEYKNEALKLLKNKKVVLPVDFIVGNEDGTNAEVKEIKKLRNKEISQFPNFPVSKAIYDIGPNTIRLYSKYIKNAQTLVWNGAMGYFEVKPYHHGTLAVARLVASRSKGKAFGVIGGGETLQSMDMVGMTEYVDLVSTGGGAMLEFLSGKKLPGVEKLRTK